MQKYLTHGRLLFLVLILIGAVSAYLYNTRGTTPDWVTGTVTRGDVREIVSVSGVIEAESEAILSFPISGVVKEVLAREGDTVVTDQILATLEQSELLADRQDAYASLLIAQADQMELVNGPRDEERSVTESAVTIARTALEHVRTEEAQKVENAYRTLLSDDLEALPTNRNTVAHVPLISGTYTCGTEGTYTLSMFRTGTQSGYSYRLSGLETGTFTAYSKAPAPFGTCGLLVQFVDGESYSNKVWDIVIPNTRSSTYTARYNAYILAREQEKNAIRDAEQTLEQTLREQALANATPRDEALVRANANIMQREARLNAINARIRERTLVAPFTGIITKSALTRGEVARDNAMTLVASDIFGLTVRVPEIDITKLSYGQFAEVRFDAKPDEMIDAEVRVISETATMIDGVAYFEAILRFENPPSWFRSGLNADVNIIKSDMKNTLKLPKRFLVTEGDTSFILAPEGTGTRKIPIQITFTGNDGFVAITGDVKEGDILVAP